MRIIPETRHLRTVVEEKGIPGHFTQWEDYSRRYLRFQAGEQILTAGKETPGFYFLLQGSIPVSYTHLDVYKRQCVGCAQDNIFHMVQLPFGDFFYYDSIFIL